MLTTHMGKKHEESYSCTLCDKYFGTKSSLAFHNKYFHNIKNYCSESETHQLAPKDGKEMQQLRGVKKSKKKKKKEKREEFKEDKSN